MYELGHGEWRDPHLRELLEEILPARIELKDFELRQSLPGVGLRTLLLNARLLQQADGAVEMILLALEDVTERRRLAQQLNETLRELERRNRELQDFASIASHDLQEPLRKIRAFSDRLTIACGDALPADARDYLARIQSAAARMSTLDYRPAEPDARDDSRQGIRARGPAENRGGRDHRSGGSRSRTAAHGRDRRVGISRCRSDPNAPAASEPDRERDQVPEPRRRPR